MKEIEVIKDKMAERQQKLQDKVKAMESIKAEFERKVKELQENPKEGAAMQLALADLKKEKDKMEVAARESQADLMKDVGELEEARKEFQKHAAELKRLQQAFVKN